ncbi:hypothetical protein BLOT_004158 [Blomia tropicalis]|nr:hypothetical protein BLOT_004158 [Blomia tropicalis]
MKNILNEFEWTIKVITSQVDTATCSIQFSNQHELWQREQEKKNCSNVYGDGRGGGGSGGVMRFAPTDV